MTKAEIVEKVYEKIGFSKKETVAMVDNVFDIIRDTLADGEKVKIANFGNFEVKQKKSRRGRNPQTGQAMEISARRVLSFKPSVMLKRELNRRA
ncbi:MAG: integration host factor subunit alpha [Proteobacteria bacterium]|nr:integration host factor subunit alpha [Pseudomonadota bacterium]